MEVENRVEKSLYRQLASKPNFLCRTESAQFHVRDKIVFRSRVPMLPSTKTTLSEPDMIISEEMQENYVSMFAEKHQYLMNKSQVPLSNDQISQFVLKCLSRLMPL